MSEEFEDIVDNLREPSVWIRILFMVGFALLLYLVITPVLLVLGLAQALFVLFTGEDNEKLRGLGGALAEYVHQILSFFTYNTNEKPFPFSDFPEMNFPDGTSAEGSTSSRPATESEETKSTSKKKTTKKKAAAKKKASKKSEKAADSEADDKAGDKTESGGGGE